MVERYPLCNGVLRNASFFLSLRSTTTINLQFEKGPFLEVYFVNKTKVGFGF